MVRPEIWKTSFLYSMVRKAEYYSRFTDRPLSSPMATSNELYSPYPEPRKWLRAAIFVVCIVSMLLFPFLSLALTFILQAARWNPPHWVTRLLTILFYIPQMTFPYFHVYLDGPHAHGDLPYFNNLGAFGLSMFQWSIVTIVFVWLAGRLRLSYFIPLALLVIIVLAFGCRLRWRPFMSDYNLRGFNHEGGRPGGGCASPKVTPPSPNLL